MPVPNSPPEKGVSCCMRNVHLRLRITHCLYCKRIHRSPLSMFTSCIKALEFLDEDLWQSAGRQVRPKQGRTWLARFMYGWLIGHSNLSMPPITLEAWLSNSFQSHVSAGDDTKRGCLLTTLCSQVNPMCPQAMNALLQPKTQTLCLHTNGMSYSQVFCTA